jgi:uncharacterized protein (DUF4415 family)
MAIRKRKSTEYHRRKPGAADFPTPDEGPAPRTWMVAERGEFYRPVKEQITLRLDKDVLAWFKAGGEGYQTRINEALREYVVSRLSRGSS